MRVEEILTLIKAGYSKEEISAMNSVDPEPNKKDPDPEPNKKDPDPEPNKKDPDPEPNKKDADPDKNDMINKLIDKLDKTVDLMIKSNIINSNNKKPEAPASEDLLAEVIKPPRK